MLWHSIANVLQPSQNHHTLPLVQGKATSVTLLNDYIVLGSLGKGTYGSVKLCYNMLDDALYALKVGFISVVGGVGAPDGGESEDLGGRGCRCSQGSSPAAHIEPLHAPFPACAGPAAGAAEAADDGAAARRRRLRGPP